MKGNAGTTSKLSREHAVELPVPGFTSIVGGKYTTYRVMAIRSSRSATSEP